MKAWLHRKNKPTWNFEPSTKYHRLIHTTRYGKIYGIFADMEIKPFWVGLLIKQDNRDIWCTVEREIRAESIEFEGGGRYIFPK